MKTWDDEAGAAIPDPQARKAVEKRKLSAIKQVIREAALVSPDGIECLGYVEAVRHLRRSLDLSFRKLNAIRDTLRSAGLDGLDEERDVKRCAEMASALRHWVECEIAATGYDETTAEGVARLNVLQHARNEAFAACERSK